MAQDGSDSPPPASPRPPGRDHHHDHGHDHSHEHEHDHEHGRAHDHSPGRTSATTQRALASALALTATFMVVEFVAGHLARSLALIADAWHMLSDVGALSLALFATRLGGRPRSARKTFGYKRFEVLAALANGVLLGAAAVLIVSEAVQRLRAPTDVAGLTVVGVGVAGLVVNLSAAWLLHRDTHSVNVRAALAHVLGDALGSCAAIVAGLVVHFTGENRADPLLSMGVALILLWSAWRIVSETAHILMEGTPAGFDPVAIEQALLEVPGVASVHDVHVWSISAGEPAVTAHVVLEPGPWHGVLVAREAAQQLEQRWGIRHCTIQPEPPDPGLVQLGRR
jgi:cobalt-zinc-cadmium efflux system protein